MSAALTLAARSALRLDGALAFELFVTLAGPKRGDGRAVEELEPRLTDWKKAPVTFSLFSVEHHEAQAHSLMRAGRS